MNTEAIVTSNTEERLSRLEAELEAALRRVPSSSEPARVRRTVSALALGALVSASAGVALSQAPDQFALLDCVSDLSLVCFAAGPPPRAAELNHNFAQLTTLIEEKTGALVAPGIQADSFAVTGDAAAGSLHVRGLSELGGAVTMASGLTVNGRVETASELVFRRTPGSLENPRTMHLWTMGALSRSCASVCAPAVCVGAWQDDGRATNHSCAEAGGNHSCVCVGPRP